MGIARRKRGLKMKTGKFDVKLGRGDVVSWELKGIEYSIPETLPEWIEEIGESAVLKTLETFDLIRRQDAVRRAKVGGKNTLPCSDETCRKIGREFKLFQKTTFVAGRRPPTAEEALAALSGLSPEKLLEAIAALKAKAEEGEKTKSPASELPTE